MINVGDLTITSLDVIKAFSMGGVPRFILDELQNAKIANTQEKQEITGKGGRKLNSLKKNKAVVVSGTNGLISAGLLETQTGGTFTHMDSTPVSWVDYLVISGNGATTEYKAAGTVGAEIEALYIKGSDGVCGEALEQASTTGEGKFTYNPESKELAFEDGAFDDGTEIVVFYTRNVVGDVLTNESDKYSEKLQLYIDATVEDKCGNMYHAQFYIPKADFSGDFDIDMGENQAVHAFEAESLAGACGVGSSLWTYTVFGVNQDAA